MRTSSAEIKLKIIMKRIEERFLIMSCKDNRDNMMRRIFIEGHSSLDKHTLEGGDHVYKWTK